MNVPLVSASIFTLILIMGCSTETAVPSSTAATTDMDNMDEMDSMDNMGVDSSLSSQDYAPLVGGLYEGGEVLFVHTETSDPDVATKLTEMMGGPEVVLVPELACV